MAWLTLTVIDTYSFSSILALQNPQPRDNIALITDTFQSMVHYQNKLGLGFNYVPIPYRNLRKQRSRQIGETGFLTGRGGERHSTQFVTECQAHARKHLSHKIYIIQK